MLRKILLVMNLIFILSMALSALLKEHMKCLMVVVLSVYLNSMQ